MRPAACFAWLIALLISASTLAQTEAPQWPFRQQKVMEAGIDIPFRVTDIRLRDMDMLAQALGGRTVAKPAPDRS